MKIKVLQKHIDEGNRNSCISCPIALALADCTNKTWFVGADEICLSNDSTVCKNLPEIAMEFIQKFDSKKEVSPFEFEINDD